jgi:cell wall assembly regulator SMI1
MSVESALAVYQEYEELARAAGATLAQILAPGHPDPAAALDAALPGFTLPDDLIAWWMWHDGTIPSPSPAGPWWFTEAVGVGWSFRSLEGALARRRDWLETADMAAEPPELPAEAFWPPTWLPVVSDQNSELAVDLARTDQHRGPIFFPERETLGGYAAQVTEHWTEVVGWWVTLLRVGATTWDPQFQTWVTDRELVPDELRGNPVAYSARLGDRDPRFNNRSPY